MLLHSWLDMVAATLQQERVRVVLATWLLGCTAHLCIYGNTLLSKMRRLRPNAYKQGILKRLAHSAGLNNSYLLHYVKQQHGCCCCCAHDM